MTRDFGARSRLTGWKAMFGKMANFAAAFIPGRFIAAYGKDSPLPFLYTGLVFAAILLIALAFLYKNSWERPDEELQKELEGETPLSFMDSMKKLFVDISSTFRVKTFRHHLGMYLGGFSAEWLFTSAFTYFIVFSLFQSSEMVSNLDHVKGNYLEASASCMILYAIAKGVRKGYLPEHYHQEAEIIRKGIIDEFITITEEGLVNLNKTVQVSGLGGKDRRDGTFAYYISEPIVTNDPKGIGAFIQAMGEAERI